MQGVLICIEHGKERKKIMIDNKIFIQFSSLLGIFISGYTFGTNHWYIGFAFIFWSLAAMAVTGSVKDKEELK